MPVLIISVQCFDSMPDTGILSWAVPAQVGHEAVLLVPSQLSHKLLLWHPPGAFEAPLHFCCSPA